MDSNLPSTKHILKRNWKISFVFYITIYAKGWISIQLVINLGARSGSGSLKRTLDNPDQNLSNWKYFFATFFFYLIPALDSQSKSKIDPDSFKTDKDPYRRIWFYNISRLNCFYYFFLGISGLLSVESNFLQVSIRLEANPNFLFSFSVQNYCFSNNPKLKKLLNSLNWIYILLIKT